MNISKIQTLKVPNKKEGTRLFSAFCIITALQLSGCANLGVQPWERDLLAKDEMALNADAVDIGLDEHIYFSKEGTSGGRSFAGGGCGCN
jgi:hypothetical protein